jgi:hypothetical protein
MYICVYVYACVYACVYVCVYACVYICVYICVYMCVYRCLYWCLYMCIHVHVYIHIHIQDLKWWTFVNDAVPFEPDGNEFFTRMGRTTILQQASKLTPVLALYYDLLERFGDNKPGSMVWCVPLTSDSYSPHCLYTSVACGYKPALRMDAIADRTKQEGLRVKYENQANEIEQICSTQAFLTYTRAHRALLQTHLLTKCDFPTALAYSRTAPVYAEDESSSSKVQARKHPQLKNKGKGLYARQALAKDVSVCRYLGTIAHTHIHTHTHTYTCIHTYTHIYTHIPVQAHVYIRMHKHICKHDARET